MKTLRKTLLTVGIALLGVASAQAVPVTISFSGTVSSMTNPNFAPLLAVGDTVSGSVQFDFAPPDAFQFSGPISGGYTAPAGAVSGLSPFFGGESATYAQFVFKGTGPTALVGGYQRMLAGIEFVMGLDGLTASLSDYLALGTSDFTIDLVGTTDYGFGTSYSYFDVQVGSASVALAPVPDCGSTALLTIFALGTLSLYRRRAN